MDTKRMDRLWKRAKPFLDEKLKLKQRLNTFYMFIENTTDQEQIAFFQEHSLQVYTVMYDCWTRQVEKIKTREKQRQFSIASKEVVDLLRILTILRKILLYLPDKIRDGWQRRSIVGILQILLTSANHPKLRLEGFRLLLLFFCTGPPSNEEHIADAISLYANAIPLAVFDTFTPPALTDEQRRVFEHNDVMDEKEKLRPWSSKGKGTLGQTSIDWDRKLVTVGGTRDSADSYKTHLLASATPFTSYDAIDLFEEILQNLMLVASSSDHLSLSDRPTTMLRAHSSLSKMSSISSVTETKETDLPAKVEDQGTTAKPSKSVHAENVMPRLTFLWSLFSRSYLRLLFPAVSRKNGVPVQDGEGFPLCPPPLLQSLIKFLIRYCIAPGASTQSGALQLLLLNDERSRDMVHEWLCQAMLLPYVWSDVLRGAVGVLRVWCGVENEDRPQFLQLRSESAVKPATPVDDATLSPDETIVNGHVRRYIGYLWLIFSEKNDAREYGDVQHAIFREVIDIYQTMTTSSLPLNSGTYEMLLRILLTISEHVLFQKDRYKVLHNIQKARELATLVFETVLFMWIRSGLQGEIWISLCQLMQTAANQWPEAVITWKRVMLQLTYLVSRIVYGVDLLSSDTKLHVSPRSRQELALGRAGDDSTDESTSEAKDRTTTVKMEGADNPSRIPILRIQYAQGTPDFSDLSDIDWTEDRALFDWKNMLCILGDVNAISQPDNHSIAMSCLVEVWDLLEKCRASQPWEGPLDADDSHDLKLPPVWEFASWIMAACRLPDSYAAGRAAAYGLLCRMFCKRHDQHFPDDYYFHFYWLIIEGLEAGDPGVIREILANLRNLFLVDLPGCHILIPTILRCLQRTFLEAPKSAGGTKLLNQSRADAVTLLSSMICFANYHLRILNTPVIAIPSLPPSRDNEVQFSPGHGMTDLPTTLEPQRIPRRPLTPSPAAMAAAAKLQKPASPSSPTATTPLARPPLTPSPAAVAAGNRPTSARSRPASAVLGPGHYFASPVGSSRPASSYISTEHCQRSSMYDPILEKAAGFPTNSMMPGADNTGLKHKASASSELAAAEVDQSPVSGTAKSMAGDDRRSPTVSVDSESISGSRFKWEDLKLELKRTLLSFINSEGSVKSANELEVKGTKCMKLWTVSVMIMDELINCPQPSKEIIDDCVNTLLDHLSSSSTRLVSAAADGLVLLAENLSILPHIDKLIMQGIMEKLVGALTEQMLLHHGTVSKQARGLIVSRLLYCLLEWVLAVPQDVWATSRIAHMVFEVIENAWSLTNQSADEPRVSLSSSTTTPPRRSRLSIHQANAPFFAGVTTTGTTTTTDSMDKRKSIYVPEVKDIASLAAAMVAEGELNEKELIKETADNVLIHIMHHLGNFPGVEGSATMNSQIPDPAFNDEGDSASERALYFVHKDSTLITLVDMPGDNLDSRARIIVRDRTGRYTWDNALFYETLREGKPLIPVSPITTPHDDYIQSATTIDPTCNYHGVCSRLHLPPDVKVETSKNGHQFSDPVKYSRANAEMPVWRDDSGVETVDMLSELLAYIGEHHEDCLLRPNSTLNTPAEIPPFFDAPVYAMRENISRQMDNERAANATNSYPEQDPNDKAIELISSSETPEPPVQLTSTFVASWPPAPAVFPRAPPYVNARLLLSHLGHMDFDGLKDGTFTLLAKTPALSRDIKVLDRKHGRETVKVAVLYVAPGQEDGQGILSNDGGSRDYDDFVASLGWKVDLTTHPGFLGGLERGGANGSQAAYYCTSTIEMIFHDATRMPLDPHDPKQLKKKRHIGNDHVHIIWNEHYRDYRRGTIGGDFGNAQIIITPQVSGLYAISVLRDTKVPAFGPLHNQMVVSKEILGALARQTAINAYRAALAVGDPMQQWLKSEGVPMNRHSFSARKDDIKTIADRHKSQTWTYEKFLETVFAVNFDTSKDAVDEI
ncbi:hypothetical protein BC832DRAFT_594874 [Gaertneriomyces semiglobifer]|nr:hypothetical protein BC832DRAFT_594874 [Gaertneriomyces semiglobifer]